MELCSKDEILDNPINIATEIYMISHHLMVAIILTRILKNPKGFTTESIYAHVFFRIST